ncbi:uncharacterized protein NEMAJ01_1127 [Nematocida major]|uniref:uncharacterized protein n=1 Tax=Nematocida major TaxID=1912982 RepID=UPI00200793E6|nr:uncharacterized protein NEMAJ01_1127 [Nematocida major]KAH9386231.1 hypothetical protein NEMAJ01_1127 [Nematocida major]
MSEEAEKYKKRIANAIKTIGNIFGYEVELKEENKIVLRSLYAFDEEDIFILQISEKGISVERNAYLKKFEKERALYLDQGKSIGAFLSAVTLSLFEQSTFQ